jgi:DNA-binding NarL/FixJ family response regulator
MPVSVVLVDDHPFMLGGLEQVLRAEPDFEVLAACGTVDEGWQAVSTHKPDLIVLDLKLGAEDGRAILRRLDPGRPPSAVVLTAWHEEDVLLDAVRLGARGIVLKATAPRVLEDCLRAVHRGERWLNVAGVDLAERLAQRQSVEAELESALTRREMEIVRLVALRLETQEISDRLEISVGTVKIHLHHVYDKLGLTGRQDLLRWLWNRRY